MGYTHGMEHEQPKRGRGRPTKLPAGKPHGIRCVLVNGELERFNEACKACGLSQMEFSRAAVLHAVDVVLGRVPVTPKPKPKPKK